MTERFDFRRRIALNLRRLRLRAQLRQEDVVERFDGKLSTHDLSRYENAHVTPSDAKLIQLAQIYGVDVSAFYAPVEDEA